MLLLFEQMISIINVPLYLLFMHKYFNYLGYLHKNIVSSNSFSYQDFDHCFTVDFSRIILTSKQSVYLIDFELHFYTPSSIT